MQVDVKLTPIPQVCVNFSGDRTVDGNIPPIEKVCVSTDAERNVEGSIPNREVCVQKVGIQGPQGIAGSGGLTKTEADNYYYPLYANPSGYLNSASGIYIQNQITNLQTQINNTGINLQNLINNTGIYLLNQINNLSQSQSASSDAENLVFMLMGG
jgi:hypothetical protein